MVRSTSTLNLYDGSLEGEYVASIRRFETVKAWKRFDSVVVVGDTYHGVMPCHVYRVTSCCKLAYEGSSFNSAVYAYNAEPVTTHACANGKG
jgi:hypothetical protein